MRTMRTRSWAKSFSWRIVATLTTLITVYIVTGELLIAGTISGIDCVIKLVLYYFHERAWDYTDLGRISEN